MKKVFSILTALMLAILASAPLVQAEAENIEFAGCWAMWVPNAGSFGAGNFAMILILNEDGTMAFIMSSSSSSNGNPASANSITGLWEKTSDGVMILNDEKTGGYVFTYEKPYLWLKEDTMDCGLRKIQDYELGQLLYHPSGN